jgi:hypothetical protein
MSSYRSPVSGKVVVCSYPVLHESVFYSCSLSGESVADHSLKKVENRRSEVRDQGSEIRGQGSGVREQGTGVRDQGSEDWERSGLWNGS